MAAEQENQNQGQNSATSKLANAANAAKTAMKAAGKAATGNVVGAAVDVLKNKKTRQTIIAVVLILCFSFVFLFMAVGAIISAVIQWIADTWQEHWEEAWDSFMVTSGGSLINLYTIGTIGSFILASGETGIDIFEAGWHWVSGQDATNSADDMGGTNINEQTFQTTVDSIKDKESLVGVDGALVTRIYLVKTRVEQRGKQLKAWCTLQYDVNIVGITVAASLANIAKHPFLYNGIDNGSSHLNIDTEVFNMTDIQCLKILAAYCAQHNCSYADVDMWDLLDYCGWYAFAMSSEALEVPDQDLYYSELSAIFAEDIVGVPKGTNLDKDTYQLSAPITPIWFGTCAPQWYYEEIAQINAYKEAYDRAVASGDTEALAKMYQIPTDDDGDIKYYKFEKLDDVKKFGIIDSLFSCNASMSVERTEYHSWDEDIDETIAGFTDWMAVDVFGYDNWESMVSSVLEPWLQRDKETYDRTTKNPRKFNGKYCTVIWQSFNDHPPGTPDSLDYVMMVLSNTCNTPGTYTIKEFAYNRRGFITETGATWPNYHLTEYDSVNMKENIPGSAPAFGTNFGYDHNGDHGLAYGRYYQLLYCNCLEDAPPEHEEHKRSSAVCDCYQKHEHKYKVIDTCDTFIDEADMAERNEAFELIINIDIVYTARSVDDLVINVLGLWPGDLMDTVLGTDGKTYPADYPESELLEKTWTDTFKDDYGAMRTITFERMEGYQYEHYLDYIRGVAADLSMDLDGLLPPENGYGDTIVTVAQKEKEYIKKNKIFGGDRYWQIIQTMSGQRINAHDKARGWQAAFVLACAYQCGYVGALGCFGEYSAEELPTWCGGLWNGLVENGGAVKHTRSDYTPVKGDIVFFAATVGSPDPYSVGIVIDVTSDGYITVIAGNVENQVKQFICEYAVGSDFTDIDGTDLVVSGYITPNYPRDIIDNPMFTSVLDAERVLEFGIYAKNITFSYTELDEEGKEVLKNTPPVLLVGYGRFRKSQIQNVVRTLKTEYPERYSEELMTALTSGTTKDFMEQWNTMFADNHTISKQIQLEIYTKNYIRPMINDLRKRNGFNWAATPIREELILMLTSTTDKHYALQTILRSAVEDCPKQISDEELLTKFMTDDYLVSLLESNQEKLWPDDPQQLRDKWLYIARTFLNELREHYITSTAIS